jgi:hypothetical protein
VRDYTPEERELAMHEENMRRVQYTVLEEAQHLKRCKELRTSIAITRAAANKPPLLAEHCATVAQTSATGGVVTNITDDIAKATGKSRRMVQDAIATVTGLTDHLTQTLVKGTPVEDSPASYPSTCIVRRASSAAEKCKAWI